MQPTTPSGSQTRAIEISILRMASGELVALLLLMVAGDANSASAQTNLTGENAPGHVPVVAEARPESEVDQSEQASSESPIAPSPPITPSPPHAPRRLGDVVVRASAADERLFRVPLDYGAARDIITPEEVEAAGAMSAQDLLRRTPSIFVFDETGTDSKPNIAVRGITSNSEGAARAVNVTMLADGVPLAPAPYGHAGASIFPFTLERVHAVDVLRGGYTSRYGPNTVAGAINYLTKPIPERMSLEQRFMSNSYGDSSSYTSVGGTWGDLGILADAVYKSGSTYRDHGDFTIQNYALKSSYQFSESFRGLFQFENFNDDSDLADGLSPAALAQDPSQSRSLQNRFFGKQTRGNFRLEWDLAERTQLDLIGYAWDVDRTFELGSPLFYGSNPDRIDSTPRPMSVWALQPQIRHEYDLDSGSGRLIAGIRYHDENIQLKSIRTLSDGTQTIRSNNRYDYGAWSAFLENTFLLDRWTVTPGLRLEDVDMSGRSELTGDAADRSFSQLLPALSASYAVTDDWAVYSNVQSSFLAPQANQIELTGQEQSLDAQTAWTYELGTRGSILEGALQPDLTFYWIDYEGRIERDPDFNDVFLNRANTRHNGVELAVTGQLDRVSRRLEGLQWHGSLSYNDSEFTNGDFDGHTVPQAPHWLASFDLLYRDTDSGLWAGMGGFHVGEAYSDSENTEVINDTGTRGLRPSYTVWNLRGGWDVPLTDDVTLKLQLGANNLFDESYFEIRAGRGLFPGPPQGTYTTLGIQATF